MFAPGAGGVKTEPDEKDSGVSVTTSKDSELDEALLGRLKLDKCGFCSVKVLEKTLLPCILCQAVAYCSPDHQQFDWKRHKPLCRLVASGRIAKTAATADNDSLSQISELDHLSTASSSSSGPSVSASARYNQFPPGSSILPGAAAAFSPATSQLLSRLPHLLSNPSTSGSLSGQSSVFRPYLSERPSTSNSTPVLAPTSGVHIGVPNIPLHRPSTSSDSVGSSVGGSPCPPGSPSTLAPGSPSKTTGKSNSPDKDRLLETDDPDIQIIEVSSSTRANGATGTNPRKRQTPLSNGHHKPPYKDHTRNTVYSITAQEHQAHLMKLGCTMNIRNAMVVRLRYIAEHVIRSVNEFGWCVVDNFMGQQHCKFTSLEIDRLYERGLFSAGKLMESRKKDEQHIRDIRSDEIFWYDGTDPRASDACTVRLLVSMIDSVIQHFNDRIPPFEIGGRSRAMIAVYPGNGTRYVRHVDNPVKDGRCITVIYYCNENWNVAKDGGALRLYPETSVTAMDVDPRADRLVFFWSDKRIPHEVMPVFRHRYAITIWYMDKGERQRALNARAEAEAQEKAPITPMQETGQRTLTLNRDELSMLFNKTDVFSSPASSIDGDHQPSPAAPPGSGSRRSTVSSSTVYREPREEMESPEVKTEPLERSDEPEYII